MTGILIYLSVKQLPQEPDIDIYSTLEGSDLYLSQMGKFCKENSCKFEFNFSIDSINRSQEFAIRNLLILNRGKVAESFNLMISCDSKIIGIGIKNTTDSQGAEIEELGTGGFLWSIKTNSLSLGDGLSFRIIELKPNIDEKCEIIYSSKDIARKQAKII